MLNFRHPTLNDYLFIIILFFLESRACVYDCSGKADGDYPSCRKCTEFVSCSNGLLYYMPCPVNLEWDDRQYVRRCEYHPSPTCCLDPTTTTTTSTTQAVPTTETPTTTTQETPVEATTMGDTPTTTASCDRKYHIISHKSEIYRTT